MSKSRKQRPRSAPKTTAGAPSSTQDPSAQGTLGNAALLSSLPPQDVGKNETPTIAGIAGIADQTAAPFQMQSTGQVTKVDVRGYDPVKKKEIVGNATPSGALGTKDGPGLAMIPPDTGKDEKGKKDPTKG